MSQQIDGRSSVLYENRYCDQNEFDIIMNDEGKENKGSTNSFIKIDRVDVKLNVVLIPILRNRCYAKTAVIDSGIFLLGRSEAKVRKTSCVNISSRSTWKNLTYMPDSRMYFSVCSFMKSIYLLGVYF